MVEMIGCHVTLHFLPSFHSAASPATLVALVLVDWHPLLYRLPTTLVAIVSVDWLAVLCFLGLAAWFSALVLWLDLV
jgi:hypothetical protein